MLTVQFAETKKVKPLKLHDRVFRFAFVLGFGTLGSVVGNDFLPFLPLAVAVVGDLVRTGYQIVDPLEALQALRVLQVLVP